jgi:allantoicase
MIKSKNKVTLSADPATGYSAPLDMGMAASGSFHIVVAQTTATFAVTATVWASNIPIPDLDDDTDWVEVTSLMTAPTISGAGKHYVVIDTADGVFERYRMKYARTGGAGIIRTYGSAKDTR